MELGRLHNHIQPVTKVKPVVTHLIYANDLIVVIKGEVKAVEKLKEILEIWRYMQA